MRKAPSIRGQYESDVVFHPAKPLTRASYLTGDIETIRRGFVEPVAIGEVLPPMPLFRCAEQCINIDLEGAYFATWALDPAPLKPKVKTGLGG